MRRDTYKYAYVGIAIIIIILMSLFAQSRINTKPNIDIQLPNIIGTDFSEINMTDIYADTLINLAKIAYQNLIQTNIDSDTLYIRLQNPNALGSDLFNNNDKLLGFKLKDYGFEFSHDVTNGTTTAKFLINKGNFVSVPNDVLMQIMYKAYNK